MEILDSQSNILINCQFSRHCSMEPLSPVLLFVEKIRGLGWGWSGGCGVARKSSIFLWMCICVLIIPLEIHLCMVVPSICCLQFCFWQQSLYYQGSPGLFCVLSLEGVGAIITVIKLSTYCSPFGKGQTACPLKEPKVHEFFLHPASWGQSWCCRG